MAVDKNHIEEREVNLRNTEKGVTFCGVRSLQRILNKKMILAVTLVSVGSVYLAARCRGNDHEQRAADVSEHVEQCDAPLTRNSYEIPETKRYIPIVIHRVFPEDVNYRGLYNSFITRGIGGLNDVYAPANMEFYVQEVRDINDNYLSQSLQERNAHLGAQLSDDGDASFDHRYKVEMTQQNYEDYFLEIGKKTAVLKAINIYVLPEYDRDSAGVALSAFDDEFVENNLDMIVVSYNDVMSSDEVFAHEIGHVFGLNHTHGRRSKEKSGDCSKDDDALCDTPPDPGPYDEKSNIKGCTVDENCRIDFCGDPKYMDNPPDPFNIMSYYEGCGSHLSKEQLQVINCDLEREKPYLIGDKPSKEVDLKFVAKVKCDDGGFVSIQEAVDRVIEHGGGTVQICEGVYHELIQVHGLPYEGRGLDSSVIEVVIEATSNENNEYQRVVIDGDYERGFVNSECYSSFGSGCFNIIFREITFTHGFAQSEPLIDLSSALAVGFDNVRVLDSESEWLSAINLPFQGGTIFRCSSYEGIKLDRSSSLILMNSGYLEMDEVTFSHVGVSGQDSGNGVLINAYHLDGQQDADIVFADMFVDSVSIPFMKMVKYADTEASHSESKILKSHFGVANCDIATLKCD